MKLSEIEGVKLVSVWADGLPYALEPVDKLHTPEQMQEYAKAKVKELLFEQLWNDRFYVNSKIFFDKEVEKICSSIFEEDTKNDKFI